jgi:hypothetical protein
VLVDPVEGLDEIPHHVTLAGDKLVTPVPSLVIALGSFLSVFPGRRLPGLVLGGTLARDRRQAGQDPGGPPMRAPDAVSLVKLKGKLQGLVTLG